MQIFAALPQDLNSLSSNLKSFPIMQALGEGPRQSRRMDAAKPLDLNSLHSILKSFFSASGRPAFLEASS